MNGLLIESSQNLQTKRRFLSRHWMRHALCTIADAMVNAPCRLLVVDDEETILFAVQDYFGPHGYQVDAVSDVGRAQAFLAERVYCVVVIDLCLGPGKDTLGLDLMNRVREQQPDTAVVVFTAYSTPEVEREVRRRGAILLEKPLPLVTMEAAIERLRRSTRSSASDACCGANRGRSTDQDT